jgi:hypothetical protein
MLKKAVQRGSGERRGESYSLPYVAPLSDARAKLADFLSILLEKRCVKSRLNWVLRPICGAMATDVARALETGFLGNGPLAIERGAALRQELARVIKVRGLLARSSSVLRESVNGKFHDDATMPRRASHPVDVSEVMGVGRVGRQVLRPGDPSALCVDFGEREAAGAYSPSAYRA